MVTAVYASSYDRDMVGAARFWGITRKAYFSDGGLASLLITTR